MPDDLTIVSPTFYPELIGTPHYVTDMAQWFAMRGWRVRVITAQPFYPRFQRFPGYDRKTRHDRLDDIEILRLPTVVPTGGRPAGRLVSELNFVLQGVLRSPLYRSPAVISVSPGSPWTTLVGRALRRPGGAHVALVHDVQAGLADALRLGSPRALRWIRANERISLNQAGHVAVLTDEMGEALRDLGVTRPIEVIPLWATVATERPHEATNERPSVQYSGNFGEKQAVAPLLDLAVRLDALVPGCELLLRGDGARFEALRREAHRRQISTIRFESPVASTELADALMKSPVHVVMQAPGSSAYVMPSKVVNALACGCQVVAATDAGSALVSLSGRFEGLTVVEGDDLDDLAVAAAKALATSGDAGARMRRTLDVQAAFSRDAVLTKLEAMLQRTAV